MPMTKNGKKPNILLVFSDQHRWCDLGCAGNTQVLTPHLDGFSREAAVFTNCISNAPVCVPARGSLLTGLAPLKHGAVTNDLPIRADVESIAHVMNRAGYRTGYIGKWHLQGIPRDAAVPEDRRLGFREWKAYNCSHAYMDACYDDENNSRTIIEGYEPIVQTDLAIDFIKRAGEEPWGLVLSWGPPHDPYRELPEEYLERYAATEIGLRPNVPPGITDANGRILDRDWATESYRGYYAHITALDEQFGRLLTALEETGLREDTIVVYTSDHGDMLGSHGETNKQWPWEESIKVPLMVSWKGRTVRCVSEELIGLIDLPVSLLGLAGLTFEGAVDGVDLHRLFTDEDARGPEACYIHSYIPCHQAAKRTLLEWRGIRTRRHTFVRTASDDGYGLFDNRDDPYQMNNLIHSPGAAGIRAHLSDLLDVQINRYDRLLPWEDFIRAFGLTDEWNRSQRYFGLPLLSGPEQATP